MNLKSIKIQASLEEVELFDYQGTGFHTGPLHNWCLENFPNQVTSQVDHNTDIVEFTINNVNPMWESLVILTWPNTTVTSETYPISEKVESFIDFGDYS